MQKSIGYFEDAIKKDPTFAPAYVGLAGAYRELGTPGIAGAPPRELRPKVISAARKALELNPALVQAHALLADVYQQEWRWSDAEAEDKQVHPGARPDRFEVHEWLPRSCENGTMR